MAGDERLEGDRDDVDRDVDRADADLVDVPDDPDDVPASSVCPSRARSLSWCTRSAAPPTVSNTGHSMSPAVPTAAIVTAAAAVE
ncbi:hypothetical protein [Mycolicibacterium wolinskyi]|uniref:hypothetical protein n=1 Tax=Mycolicibacterium wolinskyi TaxID=59750 RepID=UPI003917682A